MLVIILSAALVVATSAAAMFASKTQVLGNDLFGVKEEIEEYRDMDEFSPTYLKMLVNKRERLSQERDLLYFKIKMVEGG